MALSTSPVLGFSSSATKNLLVDVDGNPITSSNKLPVDAVVSIGTLTIGTVDQGSPAVDSDRWPTYISDGSAERIGQELMADSLPVVIASNQSDIDVLVTNTTPIPVIFTSSITVGAVDQGSPAVDSDRWPVYLSDGSAELRGQKVMATSIPVVIASDQNNLPILVQNSILTSNISQFGGTAISLGQKVSATSIPVVIASDQVIPTNEIQVGGIPISAGLSVMASSKPVVIAVDQVPVSVRIQNTITTTNISQFGGTTVSLGQKVMATSIPVVIASDQGAIPVSGTFTSGTTPVDLIRVGGIDISLGQKVMATSIPVVIASDQGNVPVSVQNSVTTTDVTHFGGTAISLGQKVMATSIPVVIASDQNNLPILVQNSILTSNISQFGGTAVSLGQKVMATSIPVVISSDQTYIPVAGDVAHDSPDSGSPQKIGGQARQTNPTAVADSDRVNATFDDLGRQIVILNNVRDLVTQTSATLSTTSETTIYPSIASTFLDLTHLVITNTSSTAVRVDIRDATAGTVRLSIGIAANGGAVIPFPVPVPQTAVTNNWTAQLSGAVTDIRIFMQFVKNV